MWIHLALDFRTG